MVNLFYGCAFMWSQVKIKTEALPISDAEGIEPDQ